MPDSCKYSNLSTVQTSLYKTLILNKHMVKMFLNNCGQQVDYISPNQKKTTGIAWPFELVIAHDLIHKQITELHVQLKKLLAAVCLVSKTFISQDQDLTYSAHHIFVLAFAFAFQLLPKILTNNQNKNILKFPQ